MKADQHALAEFVALSAILTGYEQVELWGTGVAEVYFQTVVGIVGGDVAKQLLAVGAAIQERWRGDPGGLDAAVRAEILASPKLGPVARNVIQLWYLGSWMQLPEAWRSEFGTSPADTTRVVSAAAYQQSLVYDAMAAHPPGAKQPGFGSWALDPESIEAKPGRQRDVEKSS